MITFLMQVSFCWLVFYGIYYLGLKKLTFFELNRYYLIASLILGIVIPLIGPYIVLSKPDVMVYQSVRIDELVVSSLPIVAQESFNYEYWLLLGLNITYWIGVTIVMAKLLVGFYKIYELYKESDHIVNGDFKILNTNKSHLPFSFFNMVFISKKIPLTKDFEHILKHEIAHISQGHTYDVIFIEVLKVFFWFNPMLNLYKKQMQQNHEYIADQYVTSGSYDPEYTELLLSKTTTALELALTNKFFNSQIFKRIEMMKSERSKKVSSMRYGLILPLLLVLGLIFAANEIKEVYIETNPTTVSSDTIPPLPPPPPPSPPNAPPPPPPPPQELIKSSGEIFKVVEQMPRFAGCEDVIGGEVEKDECARGKLLQYIYQNVKYPANARKNGVEGNAVVQFVVTKEGKVADVKLLRDPGSDLGTASVNVVSAMNDGPIWTAGVQNGQKVNVLYTMPIKFKLTDDKIASPTNQDGSATGFGPPPPPPPPAPAKKGTTVTVEGYSVMPPPPPPPPAPPVVRDELYKVVEEMPRFPGCESMEGTHKEKDECARQKMLEYVYANLTYPEIARIAEAEGMVVLQFVINKTGKIQELKLLRDPGAGMGEEAIKVMEKMNMYKTWIPGRQKGKAVDVLYTLPLKFKLQDNVQKAVQTSTPKVSDETKSIKLQGTQIDKDDVLYILDGKIYPSHDINKIDPSDIKSIEVVTDKGKMESIYKITDVKITGVVDIKTKSGSISKSDNASSPIIKVKGVQLTPKVVKGYKINEDSKETPSQTVNVISGKTYPNPTNGTVRIEAEGLQNGKVKMSVVDQTGKVLQSTDVDVKNNAINENIDLSKFANGSYIITLQQGMEVKAFKVINDIK